MIEIVDLSFFECRSEELSPRGMIENFELELNIRTLLSLMTESDYNEAYNQLLMGLKLPD